MVIGLEAELGSAIFCEVTVTSEADKMVDDVVLVGVTVYFALVEVQVAVLVTLLLRIRVTDEFDRQLSFCKAFLI